MGGDVIDCEQLEPWQKPFYSEVSIMQQATDQNDNKKGLTMKTVPVQRNKLKFHACKYSGIVDTEINDTKPFVIPENYFNRPYYMWEGSNFSMYVNLSYYEIQPSEIMAYIILGDENFNSFVNNPHSKPHYEYSIDLLSWDNQVYHQTLNKHGYYYVVVQVQTDSKVHVFAIVRFDFFYLDNKDYDFSLANDLETVNVPVHNSLDIYNKNITLCSVNTVSGDLDSNTIHVLLDYGLRLSIVFIIPLLVSVIYLIFLSICVTLLIVRYRNSHKRVTYHLLEDINS